MDRDDGGDMGMGMGMGIVNPPVLVALGLSGV
jgi:hypothetical protein